MQRCRFDHATRAHEPPLRRHRGDRVRRRPLLGRGERHLARQPPSRARGPLLLRPRSRQRWARPRRRGGGPRRHRAPVRALHPRADRPRRGADADRTRHHAPGDGALGGVLLRLPSPRSPDGRRDRHQREDDGDTAAGRPARARPAVPPTSWGRCRAHGRHPRRPRCSGCWRGCATVRSPTAIGTPWRWRCRATRLSSRASRASTSTWRCSPISATIISTTTSRWRLTSRRKRCSSRRVTRCAASSRPTTPGDGASSSARASQPSPCTTPTPPTLCCGPGRSEFTWRGQRISTPLTGAINVDNALLAAEAALALEELELGPEEIARAMAHLEPVQGRLQVIAAPGNLGGPGRPRNRR